MFARSCGIGVVRLFRPSLIGGPASGATKKTVKAVVKATVPAAGKACLAIGAAAAGTNLDCVTVGKALQWQPRGSRVNPFHLNDGAEYVAYEGNRYRLKICESDGIDAGRYQAGRTGEVPDSHGNDSGPRRCGTYLSWTKGLQQSAGIDHLPCLLVDASGRKFDTYAGDDKSGGECSQFGEFPPNRTSDLMTGAPLTTGICVVLPAASVGPTLPVNLSWLNDKTGIWFKTSA